MKGRSAIVTGATSGIGWAIAREFAAAGANVLVHGLGDPGEVQQRCRELAGTTGSRVEHDGADVTQPGAVAALVARGVELFSTVDILVNNAGIQHVEAIETFPEERWRAIQTVNLEAAFIASKAVLPGMRQQGWGRIINLASAHGLVASPWKSAYVASKHGLIGLTKAVALEAAAAGVTVNAICPGYVRTGLLERQLGEQARLRQVPVERVLEELITSAHPTRRLIEVEEVAALALFLCQDAARSITGAAIPIDGGWTSR
jgi:3-hydroxybutyrate dehydrogenase